jgi:glutamate-1-semialdehyde 2,1-aminomutase
MYSFFFTDQPVFDFNSAKTADTTLFGKYFQAMLKRGVYLAPSQFESLFLSTALKDELIDKILVAHKEAMVEVLGL